MEFVLTDAEIVPNDLEVVVHDDPGQIFALLQFNEVLRYLAAGTRYEPDFVDLRCTVDGETADCTVHTLTEPRPTLVVTLPSVPGKERYLLLRDDSLAGVRMWMISDRILVLPEDAPESWGVDEAAFAQRDGRILIFAGLANTNSWFRQATLELSSEG